MNYGNDCVQIKQNKVNYNENNPLDLLYTVM